MIRLKEFIKKNNVEMTKNLVLESFVLEIEKMLGVSIGMQLKRYILTYGYLAYKYIEFYGVNSVQKEKSDLIKQTEYLHKYFTETEKYITFGNLADGLYLLVDCNDDVFTFDLVSKYIKPLNVKFFDYILNAFERI